MFLVNVGAVAILTAPILLVVVWRRWRRGSADRRLEVTWLATLYVYLLVAAKYTLLPLAGPALAARYRARAPFLANSNFTPLIGIDLTDRQAIGNLLLTLPWGFLVGALLLRRRGLATAAAWCCSFGVVVELLQFALGELGVVRLRAVDVNDAILNTVGALVGLAWFAVTNALYRRVSGDELAVGSGAITPAGV